MTIRSVGQQLHSIGIEPDNILIEPQSKNTAPAILAAMISSSFFPMKHYLLFALQTI